MTLALWLVVRREWSVHRLRVLLTTAGIVAGIAIFFGMRTANEMVSGSLSATVEKIAGKATLELVAGESGFPESVWDRVRATRGVRASEPVIEVSAQTEFPREGNLLVLGIDTAGDQQFRDYAFDHAATTISDPMLLLAQPNTILLSRSFAARHNLGIGNQIALFTSSGRKMFSVQGIFQPVGLGSVYGGNVAVMDVYSAQVMFDRGHNFDRIDLINSPGTSPEQVASRLRKVLPPGIEVVRPAVRGETLEQTVAAMRLGIEITSYVALLVGIYLIFNAFSIAANQRAHDLAILRAIGVERANVQRMFLGEAALLGLAGSLLGVVAGYYLALAASRVMGQMAASVYGTAVSPQPVVFHTDLAVISIAAGIAASILGAWLPARTASRLNPIAALRNVEGHNREAVLGWSRPALGASAVLLSIGLMLFSPVHGQVIGQLFYIVLTLLGITLMLPKIVERCGMVLRTFFGHWLGAEGTLAMDAMLRAPRRCSGIVGALMIGLMFVYATGAYIQSYRALIDRWVGQMINADLIVATSSNLRSTTYHFNEAVGQQIAKLPGVRRVEDVRFTSIRYRTDSAAVIAIGMRDFLERSQGAVESSHKNRALELLTNGQAVLVSRNFANRWNVREGDLVSMPTADNELRLPVAGFVDDYRSDKGTIFLDRSLFEQYWHDRAVDFFDISLQRGSNASDVKRSIEHLFAGNLHAFVYTNAEFRGWIAGLVDQFFLLNHVQLILAALISTLGIINTLMISIAERRNEIGIIRALGGLRSQIRKIVLLEAGVLATVGIAVGVVAGFFSTIFMTHTVSLALAGYSVPYSVPWKIILASIPVVLLTALVAAWGPAESAIRSQVVKSIGYE